jgi:hypothetical protein
MKSATFTKIAAAGSLLSMAVTLYVLFGNHNWFGDRQTLTLDLDDLPQISAGPVVLERFRHLPLRCGVEQTALGAQACWSDIGTFNGIPARHVVFYFDAQQRLTAWKLNTEAAAYPALRAHFEQRYGKAEAAGGHVPLLTHAVGGGTLMLPAQPASDAEASILWVIDN